jgi:cyclase
VLRNRLITVLTFNEGTLFRTKLFEPDYRYTHNFVDSWSVDEIVIIDVTRDPTADKSAFYEVVSQFAKECFVPLSVGGGIRTLDDARQMMAVGGDKVIVNTGALVRPQLITQIAEAYGSQCVVLSIDARKTGDGYEVYSHFATTPTGKTPTDWAREGEDLGAGEVLVTSVERDGSLQGYDLDLCRQVSEAVTVPVLGLAGAGNWKHFVEGIEQGGLSAVCTQNIYHFTEISIASAKKFMKQKGIPVRL